jgi:hypothetical protein
MDGPNLTAPTELAMPFYDLDEQASVGKASSRLAPGRKKALSLLLEALDCVRDLQCGVWDFSVEMLSMRRLKLTNSELRWLIAKGLVDHAVEITLPGDSRRSFSRPTLPVFGKQTCFILTPYGARVARRLRAQGHARPVCSRSGVAGDSTVDRPKVHTLPAVPKWDRHRQQLRVGSVIVKRFTIPDANQETILAAFEESSWPPRIDDPLPLRPHRSPRRQLRIAIRSLNLDQKHRLIRFSSDANREGVCWEFCARSTLGD